MWISKKCEKGKEAEATEILEKMGEMEFEPHSKIIMLMSMLNNAILKEKKNEMEKSKDCLKKVLSLMIEGDDDI